MIPSAMVQLPPSTKARYSTHPRPRSGSPGEDTDVRRLGGVAGGGRSQLAAFTSYQKPPFRLMLLPLAWPGPLSPM